MLLQLCIFVLSYLLKKKSFNVINIVRRYAAMPSEVAVSLKKQL